MLVLEFMALWVHRYIHHSTDSASQATACHHGPFYTVCQALFYILIYRNRELMSDSEGKSRVNWHG